MQPTETEKEGLEQKTLFKKRPVITLLALTLVSVVYRLLIGTDYATTSALYVGIPALMAIGLSFVPTPRTVTGNILLWSTIFLLGIGILAIEGLICILIILPFFLAIGFIIGIFIDRARAKKKATWKAQCSFLIASGLLSLEGTREDLSFNRNETVIVERSTSMTPREFEVALAKGPDFGSADLPFLLSALFPTPLATANTESLEPGAVWTIPFDHGEASPRSLTVQVETRTNRSVTFTPTQDLTEYGKWLKWERITWIWKETPEGGTHITATFAFERRLDPAFYFSPLQRWGVAQAGEHFLDAILQP